MMVELMDCVCARVSSTKCLTMLDDVHVQLAMVGYPNGGHRFPDVIVGVGSNGTPREPTRIVVGPKQSFRIGPVEDPKTFHFQTFEDMHDAETVGVQRLIHRFFDQTRDNVNRLWQILIAVRLVVRHGPKGGGFRVVVLRPKGFHKIRVAMVVVFVAVILLILVVVVGSRGVQGFPSRHIHANSSFLKLTFGRRRQNIRHELSGFYFDFFWLLFCHGEG
mmetsp:Transcript_7678/g.21362  ORF Transcript_7678/g.21362 Transcript_7678/m.21362 type:complete len:219 (-) Transcript_7678:38-694(-)